MTIELQSRKIPVPIFAEILSYLDIADLETCHLVCKMWNRIADGEITSFWTDLGTGKFGEGKQDFIEQLIVNRPKSYQGLITRIEHFIDQMELGKNAYFCCVLGSENTYQELTITVIQQLDRDFAIRNYCFFPKGWLHFNAPPPEPKTGLLQPEPKKWAKYGCSTNSESRSYFIQQLASGLLSISFISPRQRAERSSDRVLYRGATKTDCEILDLLQSKLEGLAGKI